MTWPRTIPAVPVPGERFLEAAPHNRFDLCDWETRVCNCVGAVRGEYGEPYPDPACKTCHGTGEDGMEAFVVYCDLHEQDARLLMAGDGVLAVLQDVAAACEGRIVVPVTDILPSVFRLIAKLKREKP